ncbi:MAG TPA: amino acid permease [Acidimicrobiia bacterium]
MPSESDGGESRLARKLGLSDAVTIGLGAMVGSGIFAVLGPAAEAAGPGLLAGLAVAAVIAYANATSSAQLAARFPEAGGTYVYAGRMIGPFWGYLAGWGFVVGKIASLSVMALTVGNYAFPDQPRVAAVVAVVVMTVINYRGVEKTARATRVIVVLVLAVLALVVVLAFGAETADVGNLVGETTPLGVLRSAGLLFFAFAGYARIATLGEEVTDPRRVIPRAIPLALVITLGVYVAVAAGALAAVGAEALASSAAPLATAVGSAGSWVGPAVRVGATVASLGVLLSLLAGVSRTMFAMARDGHLPVVLGRVHPRHQTPYWAEVVAAVVVLGVVLSWDLARAVGFSAFNVLVYYGLANLSAFRQTDADRRWPRWLQIVGLVGCGILAGSLPLSSIVWGVATLAYGAFVWWLRHRSVRRGASPP